MLAHRIKGYVIAAVRPQIKNMRRAYSSSSTLSIYFVLAIGLILLLSVFSLNYWKQYYPLYLEMYDIAYHLGQTVAMDRAGGLTLTNFWQEASHPIPTYYPPFYHFCQLLLLRSGVSVDFLAKYLTWLLYPLALVSFWSFMSVCFGLRLGFYSLALFSLPPLSMEKIWGHPPFGLFCVLLPLVFLSLFKKRYLTASVLILVSLATHAVAGIILLVLFIYALHSREQRKPVFLLLAIIAVLSSPIFLMMLKRISFYSFFSWKGLVQVSKAWLNLDGLTTFFDYSRRYYVYLGILAALGGLVCYFRKGKYLLFPSFFIALLVTDSIIRTGGEAGPFRYNQILPMIIFPMLGGVFLDEIHSQLEHTGFFSRFLALKNFGILLTLIITIHLLFYALSQQPRYNRAPTIVFLRWPAIWLPYKLLFTMEQRSRLLELIEKNVAENETVYNAAGMNLTNMLSAFSRRSFTQDLTVSPKLLIREEAVTGYRLLEKMNPQFKLYILKEKDKAGKAALPRPVLSYRWISNGFILLGILIILDLVHFKNKFFFAQL